MNLFGRNNVSDRDETLEQLELLIGKVNALKVFDFYEGTSVYFSKRNSLAELHENIYADLQNKMSYGEAARKYGYTKANIRKIEQKMREKYRSLQKSGIKPPESAKPVLTTAGTYKQGELFYES
jgi:Mor family transcriptional regulator